MTTPETSPPAFQEEGEGPAVVFFHGFPLTAASWDNQVADLRSDFRCIRPDMWGCGQSPPPPPQASLEDYAHSVLSVLDEHGVENFSAVGLSMGGYVIFELLRIAAERIHTVVLADTRATDDTEHSRAERLTMIDRIKAEGTEFLRDAVPRRLLSARGYAHSEFVTHIQRWVSECSVEGIIWCQQAMAMRPDNMSVAQSIAVPTLLLVGSEDEIAPPSHVEQLSADIPLSTYRVINDAGHLSNVEQPEHFTKALRDFLTNALSIRQ